MKYSISEQQKHEHMKQIEQLQQSIKQLEGEKDQILGLVDKEKFKKNNYIHEIKENYEKRIQMLESEQRNRNISIKQFYEKEIER